MSAWRKGDHHIPPFRQQAHDVLLPVRSGLFRWQKVAGNRIVSPPDERVAHNPGKLTSHKYFHVSKRSLCNNLFKLIDYRECGFHMYRNRESA